MNLTPRQLSVLLRRVDHPVQPVDGDCEPWSAWIEQELRRAGVTRARARWAWFESDMDFDEGRRTVILAGHRIVLVDTEDLVVDFTARQYAPGLPARWIAPLASYSAMMCSVLTAQRTRLA